MTVAQLAGPWQIAAVGNTGCGIMSQLFTGTMNSSGTAVGTFTLWVNVRKDEEFRY